MKMLNNAFPVALLCLGSASLQAAAFFAGSTDTPVAEHRSATEQQSQTAAVHFHGEIELEYYFSQEQAANGATHNASGLIVETVELAVDVDINDNVSAKLLFLVEENETEPADLDEASITIHNLARTGLSLTAGRLYIPFGAYESHMASDPLTLELGETRQSALMLGLAKGGFTSSIYLFNGSTSTDPENDEVNHWGASAAYNSKQFNFGVDYISNIGDTGLLAEHLEAQTNSLMYRQIPAAALHAAMNLESVSLIAEMIQSQQRFLPGELVFETKGAQPGATHLELVFNFELAGEHASIALSAQQTEQAQMLGLPETSNGIAFSRELPEGVEFAVEYHKHEAYEEGETESELLFVLGVEF